MNREFKGIWIPKEIWLSAELTMLEKVLLVEIDSLDNENHCTAGNDYFAEFCNCSKSAVTKAIKHLKELGLIEELEFDGRHRKLSTTNSRINFTKQSSKIYEAESQNLLANNINSNIDIDTKSKDLVENSESFLGSINKDKPQKKNLYQKCIDMINKFTADETFRDVLMTYLRMRLEIRDKPMYANQWKGMLNKLDSLCGYDDELGIRIVQQSIDRGYLGFFAVSSYTKTKTFSDASNDFEHKSAYDEDYQQREKEFIEKKKRNGERTEF